MKSNRVPVKPIYPPSQNSKALMRKINEQIDKQIEWYDLNGDNNEDVCIKDNLNSIKNLAGHIENSEDIRFIMKIISNFCEIMDIQRDMIDELRVVYRQPLNPNLFQHNDTSSYMASIEEFTNDEQIKARFIAYMKDKGKVDITIDDYLLRVENLWRNIEQERKNGSLNENWAIVMEKNQPSPIYPLLNAYRYIEILKEYIAQKIATATNKEKRNLANIQSSLNMFGKALYGESYKKAKALLNEPSKKDFSRYVFMGEELGKSRLVLRVVKTYVDEHPMISFKELKDAFPDSLQGSSLGVVKLLDEVPDKYRGIGGVKRYFVDEDKNEIIHLNSGEKVAVCTQVGISNIDEFIIQTKLKLGYEIELKKIKESP